jgi:hypothetical protein
VVGMAVVAAEVVMGTAHRYAGKRRKPTDRGPWASGMIGLTVRVTSSP